MRKTINLLCILFLVQSMAFIQPVYADNEIKEPYIDSIPEELILAQPDKVRDTCAFLVGYYQICEDGIAVYYSKQDYIFETKENAIWLAEREDYPIEKLLEYDHMIKEGECTNGIYAVVHGKGNTEYGAEATYLKMDEWENDIVYQKIRMPRLQKDKRYDLKEKEEEPQTVSYYRLQGNPWAFDGKKVRVEVVYQHMEAGREAANYDIVHLRGLKEIDSVNGVQSWDDYDKTWSILIDEYRPYAENAAENIFGIGIIGSSAHVWLTCMYYMYEEEYHEQQFVGYKSMMPGAYVSQKIEIHENDVPKVIKALQEAEINYGDNN